MTRSLEERTIRKVFWRIVPFTFLLYVVSYVNRANLGYAALQMNAEVGLTSQAFGFAAGIFFLGYFLFEVPSNLALAKFGARVWIARICLTWGALATLSGLVRTAPQLYVLRFLLGVAEAGFFPGVIAYLLSWFRSKEQATTIAFFTAAIPASFLIGAPVSTWIMDHVSGFGLSGWRWMLILEGIPPMAGGIVTYFFLTDRPEQAAWLEADERAWLVDALRRDQASQPHVQDLSTLEAMTNGKVLYLSLIYFIYQTGNLGVGYWMPQVIKSLAGSITSTQIGLVTMIPYGFATVMMVIWSKHSDRTGERHAHTALPLLVAAVAFAGAGMTRNPIALVACMSFALAGLYAFKAPFWSLPRLFLTQSTATVSIAVINSIGNLGGFAGPYGLGLVQDVTGSAVAGLLCLSALVLVSFLLSLVRMAPAPIAPVVDIPVLNQ